MRKEVIGNATLYLGDSMGLLGEVAPKGVCITDPPYGIDFNYASYVDTRENLRVLIAGLFKHRDRFSRMVILCGPSQIHEYPESDWVGSIAWNTTGSFGKYGYSQWTPVLLYGPDLKGFGNVNGLTKSDTYLISGGASVGFQRDADSKLHTCPKPMNIMMHTVQRYVEDRAAVIDPFMGSGSTGVACAKLGRPFVGVEIDPQYFDLSCKRISDAYSQPDMLLEVDPVYEQVALEF